MRGMGWAVTQSRERWMLKHARSIQICLRKSNQEKKRKKMIGGNCNELEGPVKSHTPAVFR